jgi:DnaJ-class molecular chaperone
MPIERKTCKTCSGNGTVLEWGRTKRTCGYCDGLGTVFVQQPDPVLRDHAKHLHDAALRLDCPACKLHLR